MKQRVPHAEVVKSRRKIMSESILSSQLVRELVAGLPGAVVFKLADGYTAGVPDIVVTWHDVSIWLEVKYVHPRLKLRGLQHTRLLQLERAGYARYVIFDAVTQQTQIVRPSEVHDRFRKGFNIRDLGYDHVVSYIKSTYGAQDQKMTADGPSATVNNRGNEADDHGTP